VFVATVVEDRAYNWWRVESEASTFVRMLPLCTSVGVPLTDILDSSPRVSIRALALEWRLFFVVEFPWGHASDLAGVAPEPLEEFLTPSRVILPNLQKRSRCPSWKDLIGLFHAGVTTYSRWSERHLPQIELLAGNLPQIELLAGHLPQIELLAGHLPQNPCPVRGGRL